MKKQILFQILTTTFVFLCCLCYSNLLEAQATYYFHPNQTLTGDNNGRILYKSNNSSVINMSFNDKEGKRYGHVYGNGDGTNFGLLDGDGNWSYLAAKDNYTAFRVNNSEKMRINTNGNIGIATTNPTYKLHVAGNIYANGGWVRVSGNAGIYFQDYGGGFRMQDNTWIRTYGNKSFYHNTGIMRTDGIFQVGNSGNRFLVGTNGNVGIGTTAPAYKLDVQGDIHANGWVRATGNKGFYCQSHGGGIYMKDNTWIRTFGNKSFYHNTGIMRTDGTFQVGNSGNRFLVGTNGNVGIGTTTPDNKLDVKGTIRAEEVIVETGWSDFVFEEDYDLPTLEEEKKHIEAKGHLIGFESEEDMGGEVKMGEVTNRQQQKIEESVLHLINHEGEIQQLKKENELLKSKYESLEKMVIELQSTLKD